jgi:hypothetical protein
LGGHRFGGGGLSGVGLWDGGAALGGDALRLNRWRSSLILVQGTIPTSFQRAGLSVPEETNPPSKPSLLGRLLRFSRSPI